MALVTLSLDNNKHLRDASFSSYLNCSEENFVRKLAEANKIPNPIVTESNANHLYFGRKKVEDAEIGVFGAEKYFNGGMDEDINPRVVKRGVISYEPIGASPSKPKAQPQTSSVHSESSWNSQSALLQNVLNNPPPPPPPPKRKANNKRNGKSLLASLGCNCSCNDNNSVAVNGTNSKKEPIQDGPESQPNPRLREEIHCKAFDNSGTGLKRENCSSFPVKVEDRQRSSLEVFGSPPALEKKKKSLSLERRLTMLTWDPKEDLQVPASCDGTESDASSDLFEIEDFRDNSSPSFLLRQTSDGVPGFFSNITTCYAPSEASIEWSVVTASAADVSAMSDTEDPFPSKTTAKSAAGKGIEKRRTGILLGCKSQKAVRVAGDAYMANAIAKASPDHSLRHQRLGSLTPVTRFRAEAQLTRL